MPERGELSSRATGAPRLPSLTSIRPWGLALSVTLALQSGCGSQVRQLEGAERPTAQEAEASPGDVQSSEASQVPPPPKALADQATASPRRGRLENWSSCLVERPDSAASLVRVDLLPLADTAQAILLDAWLKESLSQEPALRVLPLPICRGGTLCVEVRGTKGLNALLAALNTAPQGAYYRAHAEALEAVSERLGTRLGLSTAWAVAASQNDIVAVTRKSAARRLTWERLRSSLTRAAATAQLTVTTTEPDLLLQQLEPSPSEGATEQAPSGANGPVVFLLKPKTEPAPRVEPGTGDEQVAANSAALPHVTLAFIPTTLQDARWLPQGVRLLLSGPRAKAPQVLSRSWEEHGAIIVELAGAADALRDALDEVLTRQAQLSSAGGLEVLEDAGALVPAPLLDPRCPPSAAGESSASESVATALRRARRGMAVSAAQEDAAQLLRTAATEETDLLLVDQQKVSRASLKAILDLP